ncbi:hypothetical protein PSTT_01363 [Puccinia striiformis]|uniref:Uncharacterized protein n=1 Tax=Puccinia striiformis TaxID=27350 RepID=A0A2S4W443_9BASI|nr:hypothetical protein PSTT_01363 [Puccinia striiformis]
MADFPEDIIIRRIGALMETPGLANTHGRVLESMRGIYVSKYIARYSVAFPGFPLPEYIRQVASAKDLALLPAEAVQPNDMGPLPEEVPIITEDQAVNLGVQDDNDGREAMVRDGTPADAPPANDINLAAHEAARVALERQRPPSPFLPGGQANQIESPDKGQVSLKRQSREGDSDTDSSVDWGHFDDSADEDFIPHRHRASKPSRKRCARATTLSHNHLVGKIREPRDVTPPESDEERQSIEGPQDEEDDHSFEDCHSIEERESEEDCWSIEEDESDNLRQSKEERLLIKVHESDEDWESFEEDESDNQRQSNEERVLIEVSESDEDRESNEEGKSDREHESNEEHLQGNHGNSRFEEERQSTGVDHASRSRLPSAELFVAPPSVELQRLQFWAQPGGGEPVQPGRPDVWIILGTSSQICPEYLRCKAENVLLGEDGDCFIGEQFVNRACLGSRKATGNARANNRGDAIDVLPNPDHPLLS